MEKGVSRLCFGVSSMMLELLQAREELLEQHLTEHFFYSQSNIVMKH